MKHSVTPVKMQEHIKYFEFKYFGWQISKKKTGKTVLRYSQLLACKPINS